MDRWPLKTDLRCWNCTYQFDGIPVAVPHIYDERRNVFFVYGNFCSWSCAKRHVLDQKGNTFSCTLLSLLRLKIIGGLGMRGIGIPAAPPRTALACYGGKLSIEQYREGLEFLRPENALFPEQEVSMELTARPGPGGWQDGELGSDSTARVPRTKPYVQGSYEATPQREVTPDPVNEAAAERRAMRAIRGSQPVKNSSYKLSRSKPIQTSGDLFSVLQMGSDTVMAGGDWSDSQKAVGTFHNYAKLKPNNIEAAQKIGRTKTDSILAMLPGLFKELVKLTQEVTALEDALNGIEAVCPGMRAAMDDNANNNLYNAMRATAGEQCIIFSRQSGKLRGARKRLAASRANFKQRLGELIRLAQDQMYYEYTVGIYDRSLWENSSAKNIVIPPFYVNRNTRNNVGTRIDGRIATDMRRSGTVAKVLGSLGKWTDLLTTPTSISQGTAGALTWAASLYHPWAGVATTYGLGFATGYLPNNLPENYVTHERAGTLRFEITPLQLRETIWYGINGSKLAYTGFTGSNKGRNAYNKRPTPTFHQSAEPEFIVRGSQCCAIMYPVDVDDELSAFGSLLDGFPSDSIRPPESETMVIAFRGTKDVPTALRDLNARPKQVNSRNGVTIDPRFAGRVHRGFYEHFMMVEADLTPKIAAFLSRPGKKRIFFTGHSLGGAAAVVAGWWYTLYPPGGHTLGRDPEDPVSSVCVTFGAPRVGDAAWASAYQAWGPVTVRIEAPEDPVPRVPRFYVPVGSAVILGDPTIQTGPTDTLLETFLGTGVGDEGAKAAAMGSLLALVDNHFLDFYIPNLESLWKRYMLEVGRARSALTEAALSSITPMIAQGTVSAPSVSEINNVNALNRRSNISNDLPSLNKDKWNQQSVASSTSNWANRSGPLADRQTPNRWNSNNSNMESAPSGKRRVYDLRNRALMSKRPKYF